MNFAIAAYIVLLKAMTVAEMLPELQCNDNQLVCPLQHITCQCMRTGGENIVLTWKLFGEQPIAQIDAMGNLVFSVANYSATGKQLNTGISSNLSFFAELKPDPVTLVCEDSDDNFDTFSYSTVEPPCPPVINMVTALNRFFVSLSWTPPSYNCSLTYIVEVVDEDNASVVFLNSTEFTQMNVTTLSMGTTYSFVVASVDTANRTSNWSQPFSLAMQVPAAPVENVTATVFLQMNHIIAEWKKPNQSLMLPNTPVVSHYIIYHNLTSDGDQEISAYDTHVTIDITNVQLKANIIYAIQVAAVNVIGQGPVSVTTLKFTTADVEATTSSSATSGNSPTVESNMTSPVEPTISSSHTASQAVSTTEKAQATLLLLETIMAVAGSVLFLLILITVILIVIIVIKKHKAAKTTVQRSFQNSPGSYSQIETTFAASGNSSDPVNSYTKVEQDFLPAPPPHLDSDEFRPVPPSPPTDCNTEIPAYPEFEPSDEGTTYARLTGPHKPPQPVPPPQAGSYSELGPTKGKPTTLSTDATYSELSRDQHKPKVTAVDLQDVTYSQLNKTKKTAKVSPKPKNPNEIVYAELGKKPKNAPVSLPFELNAVIYSELRQPQVPSPPTTTPSHGHQVVYADLQTARAGPPPKTAGQEQVVYTDLKTASSGPPPTLPPKPPAYSTAQH